VDDPTLTQRLYESGVTFSSEIVETASPFQTVLLYWILPMAIFAIIGQITSRKMMNRGGNAPNMMSFGMGKSNAKVYVKSSEGIKFSDVAGEDEAKENLTEIVDYLHNPGKYSEEKLRQAEQTKTDLRLLLKSLREFSELRKLTPTIVNTLIRRIEVHNNDKSSGHGYLLHRRRNDRRPHRKPNPRHDGRDEIHAEHKNPA
jgi:plasmid stabilization system protein ParE